MNFDHRTARDELDINLIPLIDVLLVVLIFLAASTSFTTQRQLVVNLPEAQAEAADEGPALQLAIDRDGRFALNDASIDADDPAALREALSAAARQWPERALNIAADALSAHQAVVQALEAARDAGIERVRLVTEAPP